MRSARRSARRARLLDVHADADHNRSVFTLVGSEAELVAALVAGVECARERDRPAPPRGRASAGRRGGRRAARAAARRRTWSGRGRPSLEVAGADRRARPSGLPVRLAGPRARVLPARWAGGAPAAGGRGRARAGLRAGAARSGRGGRARRRAPAADRLQRQPAKRRRRGRACDRRGQSARRGGGFPGVRALGLDLPRAGLVQVSMNVEDWEAAALHEIVARIERRGARARRGGRRLRACWPDARRRRRGRSRGDAADRRLRCFPRARAAAARRVARGPRSPRSRRPRSRRRPLRTPVPSATTAKSGATRDQPRSRAPRGATREMRPRTRPRERSRAHSSCAAEVSSTIAELCAERCCECNTRDRNPRASPPTAIRR